MNALDVSNFSGVFTDEQAQAMRDVARRLIVNVHDVDIAIRQIEVAKRNCLEVGLYAQTYSNVPLPRELDKAAQIRAATGMPQRAILYQAFEDPDIPALVEEGLISTDFVMGWIERAWQLSEEVYDFTGGIYTRKDWWVRATGNNDEFGIAGARLWVAQWDREPDLDIFDAFGGWHRPTMKQYDGSRAGGYVVQVGGVSVDRNVY